MSDRVPSDQASVESPDDSPEPATHAVERQLDQQSVGRPQGADRKSEKQKMLSGELYSANDPELKADYLHGQALLEEFNRSPAVDTAQRTRLLRDLLGSLGDETTIRPRLQCDYGHHIHIGARSFLNFDCVLLDCNTITIGDDVQIAPGVHIYTAAHPVDAATRISGLEYALPVTIGNGVWLGGGTIICPGVTIGENTVIGAGSVVVKSLPANVVAAGNPCRVLRSL